MTKKDEDIQRQFEESKIGYDSVDEMAYEKVFTALKHEPAFHVPVSFSERVLHQLERSERNATVREFYWLAAGVVLLVVAAIVGAILTGFKPSFGAFRFMATYPWLLVLAISMLLLFQFLDKKLVRATPL
jgi:hypothetical protein